MEFGMVQFVYLVSSAIVVLLVIVFGAGQGSTFVPQDKDEEQEKRWKGGEADGSPN